METCPLGCLGRAGNGVHAVIGTGGALEGVITAAALRCLHGEMVARLVVDTPELKERVARMGIKDPGRIYTAGYLAPGNQITFVACGVTEGALLRGVRFFGECSLANTELRIVMYRKQAGLLMPLYPNAITLHASKPPDMVGARIRHALGTEEAGGFSTHEPGTRDAKRVEVHR